jgi:Aldehyde dehydrogenase family
MLAIRFPGVSRSAPSDEMQSFGPVVGVMKVASDEEAIRLMNYSSYGLTASVGSSLQLQQSVMCLPIDSIAAREKKTERSIRMTLSLAFLSPALVKAAIEGRLSRGFGVKRLMDLPMSWSDQWSVLGLKAPAQT